jgi:hypothetical protein
MTPYQTIHNTSGGRTLAGQIFSSIWASSLALILSAVFISIAAVSTNGKEATTIWVSKAPTFIAAGAVVLQGSITTLVGITLYQHLWSRLSAKGLSVRHIESYHRASRLSVSMFMEMSLSAAWIVGAVTLLFISFVPPGLQSAVGPVASRKIVPRQLQMNHAQLDPRMATTETAGGIPVDARSLLHRTATLALYGEESGHQYVPFNVTGLAKTTNLDFVDLECDIVEIPGKFSNVSWF